MSERQAQAGAVLGTITVPAALPPGTYNIVAAAPPTPAPTAVVVSPPAATLAVGTRQQFTAVCNDQNGAPIPGATFAWSVTGGGSIDQTGLYTPPASAAQVVVSAAVGSVFGTASVTVTAPAPATTVVIPTPQPPLSGGGLTLAAPANLQNLSGVVQFQLAPVWPWPAPVQLSCQTVNGGSVLVVPGGTASIVNNSTVSGPGVPTQPAYVQDATHVGINTPATMTGAATLTFTPGAFVHQNISQCSMALDGKVFQNWNFAPFTIDTTKLSNGPHFLYASCYSATNPSLLVVQGRWDFTVNNPAPPVYSGTTTPPQPPNPAGTFPHLAYTPGVGGKIVQQYGAGSMFVRSLFFSDAAVTPASAVTVKGWGINCLETGLLLNPNTTMQGGWRANTFAAWKQYFDQFFKPNYVWLASLLGVPILFMGDETCRTPIQQDFWRNCVDSPAWPGGAAVVYQYAAQQAAPLAVGLQTADEISTSFNGLASPVFSGSQSAVYTDAAGVAHPISYASADILALMTLLRNGGLLVSNPPAAPLGPPAAAAWNTNGFADFPTTYLSPVDSGPAYRVQSSLSEWCIELQRQVGGLLPKVPRTVPVLVDVPLTGNFPGDDPTDPCGVSGAVFAAIMAGVSGTRAYQYRGDPTAGGYAPQMAALSNVYNWIAAHEADILQPAVPSPNLGPDVWSAARSATHSNVVLTLNTLDVPQPASFDLTPYMGASKTATMYRILGSSLSQAAVGVGPVALTLAANEAVVFVSA